MPQLNTNAVLAMVAYAVITGLLNLLLSERSRVDAWAESNPRLAAMLKLLRGIGLDPWHLVAAASLLFKGQLPPGTGGDSKPVGAVEAPPLSARPRGGMDAEMTSLQRRRRLPRLVLGLGFALLLLVACTSVTRLPCSEAKLRAIDARYVERVLASCADAPSKEACPAWPALKAEYLTELKEECPQ